MTNARVVGLMSGTSADGIDAALVEITGNVPRPQLTLLAADTFPYPPGLQERILRVATPGEGRVEEICHLNFYLGELFADAARGIVEKAGHPLTTITLIGSHGQTIHHIPDPLPEGPFALRSTLQIGEPAVIAERTGITTVAHFRPRDIAAGGEGAPLTPLLHHLLFTHPTRGRVVLNIGGISNVTYLPAGGGPEKIIAFDTGPGNALIDGVVRRITGGRSGYDPEGQGAARGRVNPRLLKTLLTHPFLEKTPPRSTGKETFGEEMSETLVAEARSTNLADGDLLATVTAFTAASIAGAIQRFILPRRDVAELLLCGGGAANRTLREMLAERLPGLSFLSTDAVGFPGRAIEATAFALLAFFTVHGQPGNIPGATGAAHPTLLGALFPGKGFRGLPWR